MNFDILFESLMEESARGALDDSVIGQLLQYVDDPTIYLHFSELNKVGNNPNSYKKYNTPQGIYFYPLKIYWDKFLHDNHITVDDVKADLKNPIKNIKATTYGINVKSKNHSDFEKIRKYKFTDIIPFKNNAKNILVAKVLVNETSGFMDFAKDISKLEFENYVKVVDAYFIDLHKKYDKDENKIDYVEKFNNIKNMVVEGSRSKNNLGYLWMYTKSMAFGKINSIDYDNAINIDAKIVEIANHMPSKIPMVRWAYLLRKVLGFSGFLDSSNLGIIHPSEKTQAVVFNALDVDHIDTILNKENYDMSEVMSAASRRRDVNLIGNIKNKPSNINQITQDRLIKLIRYDKSLMKYINNDETILKLCKYDFNSGVEYLKNYDKKFSVDFQKKLIGVDARYAKHISNITEEVFTHAIKKEPMAFEYIFTVESAKAGVISDLAWCLGLPYEPYFIEYNDDPSLEAQTAAVKADMEVFLLIKRPHISIQTYMTKKYPNIVIISQSNHKPQQILSLVRNAAKVLRGFIDFEGNRLYMPDGDYYDYDLKIKDDPSLFFSGDDLKTLTAFNKLCAGIKEIK